MSSILPVLLATLCAAPLRAHEGAHRSAPGVILTKEQALAKAFPGSAVERRTAFLTEDEAKAVALEAGSPEAERVVVYYVPKNAESASYAFFERHRVAHDDQTVMVVADAARKVRSVAIVAFDEAADYLPTEQFLKTFQGRRLDEIGSAPAGTGPTTAVLARRAVAAATRRALATLGAIIKPARPEQGAHP